MPELGNNRKVYVGSESSYAYLVGETSNNLSINNNAVEVSDKSSQFQDFIGGLVGGNGSVTVHADDNDAQQIALLNSLIMGTKVNIFKGTLGSGSGLTGAKGMSFQAIITSVSDTDDNGSVSTRDFSYNTCGAITHHPGAITQHPGA